MKMKKQDGFSFGAVTLFMMFVVLSMVILTSLSLLDAKHQEKVAEKEKTELINTYEQEAVTERIFSELQAYGPEDKDSAVANLNELLDELQIEGEIQWSDAVTITLYAQNSTKQIITAVWQDQWVIDTWKKER